MNRSLRNSPTLAVSLRSAYNRSFAPFFVCLRNPLAYLESCVAPSWSYSQSITLGRLLAQRALVLMQTSARYFAGARKEAKFPSSWPFKVRVVIAFGWHTKGLLRTFNARSCNAQRVNRICFTFERENSIWGWKKFTTYGEKSRNIDSWILILK